MPTHDTIAILDYGSQTAQLIARRVREAHVYCEIHPFDVGDDFIRKFAGMYVKDDVLKLAELHDSYVFMVCVLAHVESDQSEWHDLCPVGGGPHGLDAFEASALDSVFVHKKGGRKAGMTI